jgi:hypothetical protein
MNAENLTRLTALSGLAALALAACPHGTTARPYPEPTAQEILQHLKTLRDRAASLNAETKTDVRLGADRVNVTVLMLAAWGGKLRFQAQDPNQTMAADLASDGKRYCLIDVHANCGECGAATPETVGRLVRIPLEPDEVVAVLLGTAPVIDGEASDVWDASSGHEVVTIKNGSQSERLVLDGAGKSWDLLEAELTEGGKKLWSVRHKDFHDVTGSQGGPVRLPGASLFEQGDDTVRILWRDQKVGATIPDDKFTFKLQPGLPECRSKRSGP